MQQPDGGCYCRYRQDLHLYFVLCCVVDIAIDVPLGILLPNEQIPIAPVTADLDLVAAISGMEQEIQIHHNDVDPTSISRKKRRYSCLSTISKFKLLCSIGLIFYGKKFANFIANWNVVSVCRLANCNLQVGLAICNLQVRLAICNLGLWLRDETVPKRQPQPGTQIEGKGARSLWARTFRLRCPNPIYIYLVNTL